ncbi:hypothetical protein AGLY_009042 [Aphis glycines]|uniref:Uncharacterized protein n=1 Tax=Aphis glycines TaxID=307491 RepID=A0A6G0TJR5_APHGL|nr:hypothetical protein AGLY_009042 [Aphis glycines]
MVLQYSILVRLFIISFEHKKIQLPRYTLKKKHGKICGLTVFNEINFDYIEPNKKSGNRPINMLATRPDFKKISLLTMNDFKNPTQLSFIKALASKRNAASIAIHLSNDMEKNTGCQIVKHSIKIMINKQDIRKLKFNNFKCVPICIIGRKNMTLTPPLRISMIAPLWLQCVGWLTHVTFTRPTGENVKYVLIKAKLWRDVCLTLRLSNKSRL